MIASRYAVLLSKELPALRDLVIVVTDAPGIPGSTNLIKLHQVGEQPGPAPSPAEPAGLIRHD